MNQIPYTLRTLAGEEETRQGERLFRAGRVKIAEQSARVLRCQVVEEGRYDVSISADAANAASHRCTCTTSVENGACRHIVAALMACQDAGAMDEMIRLFREKIMFVHFRNTKGHPNAFRETFHDNGDIDMAALMKVYAACGVDVPIRVDHVPTMAGEVSSLPGYDAMGRLFAIGYLKGILDATERS